MISCYLIMRVAKDPLDRIRSRTIGGKPEQFKTRMHGQPTPDGLRLMNAVVVHDHKDPLVVTSWIVAVQGGEQDPEEVGGFWRAGLVVEGAGGAGASTPPQVFFLFFWREGLVFFAPRAPFVKA